MQELEPYERLRIIEQQCDKIKNYFGFLQLYFSTQLIVVISYISFPWIYDYQRATIVYLVQRLLQYSFHLFSVLQMRKTVSIISEGSAELMDQINEPIDVWAAVKGNHNTLSKVNEFVYLVMFGIGNIVFIQHTLLLDRWVLVIQLCFGWSALIIITIILLVICMILPYMIYQMRQQRREENLRLQLQAQRLVENQMRFQDIDLDVTQPCYICLENFQTEDLIIQLACNPYHIFHSECIKPWAETSDTCPICRQRLQQQ